MVGRTLGRYQLVEEIGQGGMAVVYRGVDTTLKREVAIKVLHPHLSKKETNRLRFAREARVVATLHHDNIVEIYDFSSGDETGNVHPDAFIVTEYIRGRTLADFVEKHPRPLVEVAVMIMVEICQAVAHAHAAGVVHRDIKPENVMIRQDGVLKLMDFGIARLADDAGATMTGALMGSPNFMSPEQVSGGELDARSDLFSLGVLAYRLVTGELPFDAPNAAAVLRAILEQDAPDPSVKNPLVGRALAATIRRALAKDPKERHADAGALAAELLASIADAGIGATREELKAFFCDSAAYSAALTTKLVLRYAEAGRAHAKAGDTSAAMERFSTVLELDPSNAEVRAALTSLGRSARRRKRQLQVLGVAGLLLFTGSIGAAGWKVVADMTPAPTPAAPATSTPAPSPSLPPTTPTATPRPSPKPSTPLAATSPTASAAAATPTQLAMIAPTATPTIPRGKGALNVSFLESADLSIDGARIGDTRDPRFLNADIPLEPGDHSIVIQSHGVDGCEILSGTVHIDAGARTSKLLVNGEPRRKEDMYLHGCRTWFVVQTDPALMPNQRVNVLVDDGGKMKRIGFAGVPIQSTSGPHKLRLEEDGPKKGQIEVLYPADGAEGADVELHTKRQDEPFVVRVPLLP